MLSKWVMNNQSLTGSIFAKSRFKTCFLTHLPWFHCLQRQGQRSFGPPKKNQEFPLSTCCISGAKAINRLEASTSANGSCKPSKTKNNNKGRSKWSNLFFHQKQWFLETLLLTAKSEKLLFWLKQTLAHISRDTLNCHFLLWLQFREAVIWSNV